MKEKIHFLFQTPGGERWYVEKIELTYNSSDRHFVNIDQPSKFDLNAVARDTRFTNEVISSHFCFQIKQSG